MELGAGETGHCPPRRNHPVCHHSGDASPRVGCATPSNDTSPQKWGIRGAITPWGMLATGRGGWGPSGRTRREETEDGDSEVGARGSEWGRAVPAPATASHREEAHACRARGLTREGQFGAACKRKDRKSGQRRGQAWAERKSEEELQQS